MSAFALLLPALHALPSNAQATSIDCGEYRADQYDYLVLEDARSARLIQSSPEPTQYQYWMEDGHLMAFDLGLGYAHKYTLSTDKRQVVSEFGTTYTLAQPRTCATPPPPPPGSCRADLARCSDQIDTGDVDDATVQRWCEEDLPFACVALIERYQRQADRQVRSKAPDIDLPDPPPPVCRKGTPDFSESKCRALVEELITAMMITKVSQTLHGAATPLSPEHLEQAARLCQRRPSTAVCNRAAEKLWEGERHAAARDALVLACDQSQDPFDCRKVAPLRGLTPAQLTPITAQALPCGDYVSETGLMDQFSFRDHGLVEGPNEARMRARLENGAIFLRHDKGGDYVLRALADGSLIGQDTWNRYNLYRRQDGPAHCQAPVEFKQVPLAADCPVNDHAAASACCKRGSAYGCNIVGSRMLMTGDWQAARTNFRTVCAQGVLVGCQNLAQVYAMAGDEGVIDDLQGLCDQDPRHIACDVLETTNWVMLSLSRTLKEIADEIDVEIDTELEADD